VVVGGSLYLVGTPIGNLGDLSDRARQTLRSADIVAAEDTRRTGRLLSHFGFKRPLVSLFEGNERQRTAELLARLREGDDVALVTDAGMPSISDPGFRLVRACVDEGIEVRVVPGPSAVTAALVVSGLPVDRFVFEGFLPRRAGERRRRLRELARDPRTVVLFESPLRLATLLRDVLVELGDRQMALARELTKVHEEVVRGRVAEVLARLADSPAKGEVVAVIEGRREEDDVDLPGLVAEARRLVSGGMRRREAATTVARRRGASANVIYEELVRPTL
jgi:16S rRNA (cytidine1402-2'-O)-methyltransferase